MLRNNLVVRLFLRFWQFAAAGALAGLVVPFMFGCAAPAPEIQIRAVTPPDSLLQDCQHAPRPAGRTVADLAQWTINERGQLDLCTADKAALRAWKAGVQ